MESSGGPAGFVLESKSSIFRNLRTKNWLQLRCVHPIGAGVGDRALLLQEICRAARASSELKLIVPRAPLTRARERVRGQQETPLSLPRPLSSMGAGRGYPVDTSHPRPFFDSKWNRQGVGRIRFGIEIHHFSQPSNQELAPIEMCPPDSPTLPHQLAGLSARRGREEKEGRGELETGRLLTPSPCKPKVCALMGEGWVGVAALRPKAACAILQRAFDSGPITPTRT